MKVMSSAAFADFMLLLWDGHIHGTTSLLLPHSSSQDADLWVFDLVRLTDKTSSYRKEFQCALLTKPACPQSFYQKKSWLIKPQYVLKSNLNLTTKRLGKGFLPLLNIFSLLFFLNQKESQTSWHVRKRAPRRKMEKWQHVGKGKEKIPLRICDIILPTAHVQTKQGYVSGFHLRLFSPPALPPLFSFFPFFREVGGGRERWQNSRSLEVCPIPALNSAPQLLWFETGRVSVSFLSQPFPPFTQDPSFCSSLISDLYHCFARQPSSWKVLEKPARGNLPGG